MKTYLRLEVFVFNGQERVKAGVAHFTVGGDGYPKEFHLFTSEGNHNLLSGNYVNNTAQVYDNLGRLLHNFTMKKQRRKKKGKVIYEAREMNSSQRKIADLELEYETSGWNNRKMKELRIEFTDVSDYLAKPQVVMSSFFLVYLNRLL